MPENEAPSVPSAVGAEIRKIREQMNLTQEQFAQKIGVAARTVARWESGASAPRANVLNSLGLGAAATGILLSAGLPFVGPLVGAHVAVQAYKSHRHERRSAALNAVLHLVAEEHKLSTETLRAACRSVLVEMLDEGVSTDELIALLDDPR